MDVSGVQGCESSKMVSSAIDNPEVGGPPSREESEITTGELEDGVSVHGGKNGSQETTIDVSDEKCHHHSDKYPREQPKSIVKSPSMQSVPRSSLQCEGENTERAVLHVQSVQEKGVSGSNPEIVSEGPIGSITSCTLASSSSSTPDEEKSSPGQFAKAKAPDGGWGWMVVGAAFIVNLIADGISFSFDVIFVELLNYFGEGKAKTAWIVSLFMAMPLLSGPIASSFTNSFGCRRVTIVGSILAATGFMISALSTSIGTLLYTIGFTAGFGLGLCNMGAVVIVFQYFDKRRSLASGISACGSGIGTLIFAPLTQAVLANYRWRGTALILAGMFLIIIVCGILMRDLERTTGEGVPVSNQQHGLDSEDGKCSSLIALPTFVRTDEKVSQEVLELLPTHKNALLLHNCQEKMNSRSFNELLAESPEGALSPSNPDCSPGSSMGRSKSRNHSLQGNEQELLAILKRDNHQNRDEPTMAHLKDLRMHRHSFAYRKAVQNINRDGLRASSCPDIHRNSMTTIAKENSPWYHQIASAFKSFFMDIIDFSYFKDMRFLMFAISNFLLYIWYDVPYVYMADNAIGIGFSERKGSMLISIIGIANVLGEIGLGWIGDKEWVNLTLVYALSMALCGVVVSIIPLFNSYAALVAISGAFGLFIAANYSLTDTIVMEIFTLERFTNAYGKILFMQGVANLIGPPLAGWISDITGTYDWPFYLAGFFIVISGVMLVILPAMGKYRGYRALRQQNPQSETEV